jgi:methionyl-tRNA formyltransferase
VRVLGLLLERLEPEDVLALAPPAAADWHVSLATAAQEAGVPCLAPEDVNDPGVVGRIEAHEPDLLLSIYYTQLFGPRLLEAVRGPALNFHPSLLPRHRGVAPLVWAIAEGDAVTGLTVHHVDAGIDTGRVVLRRPIPIHPDDTGYVLHRKLALLVRAAAAELLRALFAGEEIPAGVEQTGAASYHGRRDPQLNRLDWSAGAERIRNVVRALAPPLPGAYTERDGERLVLARVEHERGGGRALAPGMVEVRAGEAPLVWAGDGPLRLAAFVEGGEVVSGEELPRRRGLRSGEVLG